MPLRTLTVSGKLKPVSFIIPCTSKQSFLGDFQCPDLSQGLLTYVTCVPMHLQGRLTLLMGPPRSGKSLFMQMLAGKASCWLCTSCMHLHMPYRQFKGAHVGPYTGA